MSYDYHIDTDGLVRWDSNNQIPFEDKLLEMGFSLETINKCGAARTAETIALIKSIPDVPMTDEERFEARAAFGPGTTVVNILTGRKTVV